MDPSEVRAIRGSLSRAAFAQLLGVTKLTVLRWELPDGKKEARRPRGRLLDALRGLAAGGERGAASPGALPETDDEGESSETFPGFDEDQSRLLPLVDRLFAEPWHRVEDDLLQILESGTLRSVPGRALASLGVAHLQIFARFDVRGALATLSSALEEDDWPRSVRGRAHALAAALFGMFDSRVFDLGRCNAHSARAEELLAEDEMELRSLVAVSRIGAARLVDPVLSSALEQSYESLGNTPVSPLVRALRETDAALAEKLSLRSLSVMLRALRCRRAVLDGRRPEDILAIAAEARAKVEEGRLAVSEPYLVVLASEIEALSRLARMDEAARVANEAMTLAKAAGLARHALAPVLARLYVHQARVAELAALADDLESDGGAARAAPSNLHALFVRGHLAGYRGEYELAAELADRVCRASDAMGVYHLKHDAFIDLVYARLLLRDLDGIRAAVRSAKEFLRDHPSTLHSALLARQEGYLSLFEGRFGESRQRLEASSSTFASLGDVFRTELSRGALAVLAIATGAPDGHARLDAVHRELGRYVQLAPEVAERGRLLAVPFAGAHWHDLSLIERLAIAVERISMQGSVAPSIESVTSELFAGAESGKSSDAEKQAISRLLETALRVLLPSSRKPAEGPRGAVDDLLPGVVAASPPMRRLKEEIARLSRSRATVLVTGESGTGKEVVARAVHDLSLRAERPYVVFNCASVPPQLFESQLFGHRKGSFTGAVSDSLGVIRAADGGTLFLDEIGELPLDVQPKLLRFLENAEIMAIGDQVAKRVDVRIVAATHRDLARQVREGAFREDLYFRLNVVPLVVPPLRDRPADVVALARFFLAQHGAPSLTDDAVQVLEEHAWPGNVRELRNVIERTMAYARGVRTLEAAQLRIGS